MDLNTVIKNKELLKYSSFAGGKWIAGVDKFDVFNPANGDTIAYVDNISKEQLESCVAEADCAFKLWSGRTASDRSLILRKWYNLILENKEDLANLITLEGGKPIKESRGEIMYGASFVEWYAEEAKRNYGDTIPGHTADTRILVLRQPIGVVAAITPWNFPVAMITRKIAPALAAGCSVIVKPAEETPLSAIALAVLAQQAGFPEGVFNVVCAKNPVVVSDVLMKNSAVKKLSFTGSTETGKLLYRNSAETVKKLSLELGGNAPFIVMDDADVDDAVEGAIISKYRNSGQTCVCANRLFLHEKIYDEFLDKFTSQVQKLKVGNGSDENNEVGPLINQKGVGKVMNLLEDATRKGAKILTGGHIHEAGDNFLVPTIISDLNEDMDICYQEIFGPVAPVFKFSNDDEAIKKANSTKAGLAAYFYGKEMSRIWRMAEALEYGMVGVNTGLISTAVAPFGGIKESGFGREGSRYGMEEYTVLKYICLKV